MSTAIERVEGYLEAIGAYRADYEHVQVRLDDLTELLRLAKLGERVEQCEVQHRERRNVVRTPDRTLMHAEFLLAWIREGT